MSGAPAQKQRFSIQRLGVSHGGEWRPLFSAYARFYDTPMPGDVLDRTWGWLCDPTHPLEGLAATDTSGHLIGLAHFKGMADTLLGAQTCWLDDLYVLDEWRGCGVGHALVASVIGISRHRGWPLVSWMTAETNRNARRVYDRLAQPAPWVVYEYQT